MAINIVKNGQEITTDANGALQAAKELITQGHNAMAAGDLEMARQLSGKAGDYAYEAEAEAWGNPLLQAEITQTLARANALTVAVYDLMQAAA